jgi:hypothetical protein
MVRFGISKIKIIMKLFFSIIQILVILVPQSVSAQEDIIKRVAVISPWEIGLSSGVSFFMTSVNPQPGAMIKRVNYWNNNLNPGIGLFAVRNISPSLGFEINLLNTRLNGTWNNKYPLLAIAAGRENPLTFDSQINQLDLMITFNLNQMMFPGDEEDKWHLYFKTGLGVNHIVDNRNFYSGNNYIRFGFGLDGGVSVSLNKKIILAVGSIFRFVNTDNLDGVHVISTDLNGRAVDGMKTYELYNFTYLKLGYRLANFSRENNSTNN